MPRYKLTIEYDGTPFVGWQIQAAALSVQGVLTEAVAAFAGERVSVNGAGRTDAGVHALGQVAHVDLSKEWDTDTVRDALTAHLRPHPVAVVAAERVAADFDARFSAVQRHYLYLIVNRRADLTLERGRAWRVGKPLDARAMHAAAVRLVGKHDFSTFRDAECRPSRRSRRSTGLDVHRDGDNVSIEASARSFLHSQVRSDGGFAGGGRRGALVGCRSFRRARRLRPRRLCPGRPPEGLYLVRVDY
jgi:tRNA pseudouridine38-40 synthase